MRRPLRTVSPVLSAFVLRLRTDALARGAVIGEVENADTGGRRVLRSVEDLLTYLATAGSDGAEGDGDGDQTGKGQL